MRRPPRGTGAPAPPAGDPTDASAGGPALAGGAPAGDAAGSTVCAEQRYLALRDLVPVGVFETDGLGRYTDVDAAWCAITGLSRDAALGVGWVTALHDDDADRVLAEWSAQWTALGGEPGPFESEFRFRAPAGRVAWVRTRAVPQLRDGRLVGYLGVVQDLTEQRAAEAALRTSERIHRSVIDSLNEGIVIQDRHAQLAGCNAAAERILGMSAAQMLDWASPGAQWQAVRADGSPFPVEEHPAAVTLATGAPCTGVIMGIRTATGDRRWISVNANPLLWDDSPQLWGVSCAFADVTDRQLVDQMKSEFVSVVSHELRTPLTSIRGSLGLLAGGALGPVGERPQRMLDIALANTDRLVRLVNDILDIERIESGTVGLARRAADAGHLVAQAVEVMQAMADSAGVTLRTRAAPAALWVDPDRIIQTLTNLISNAVKFSPAGSVVRVVAAERTGVVTFEVIDQGRGIPADKVDTVFERFKQVDTSDSREKSGTGLGLAICRTIVEQHGGLIWVRSRLGEGSTFAFSLPAAGGDTAEVRYHGPTVVVFDTTAGTNTLIRAALEEHGCTVAVPTSTEKAGRLTHRPDVLMLDLTLPSLDGWAALAAHRASPTVRDIPVIVVGAPRRLLAAATDRALNAGHGATRALVVGDDADLTGQLGRVLDRRGVSHLAAGTVACAVETLERAGPDLVVLDLGTVDDGWAPFLDAIADRGRCLALALVGRQRQPPAPGTGQRQSGTEQRQPTVPGTEQRHSGLLGSRQVDAETLAHRVVRLVVTYTHHHRRG